jgi:peptide/nickel transport system permease protein
MRTIGRLIAVRVGLAASTLLAVSAVIFALSSLLPGDVAGQVLGRSSTAGQREEFRHAHGLDRPAAERYADWLGGAVRGDFGRSYLSDEDVASQIGPSLSNTIALAAFALVLSTFVSVLAAIAGALFRGRWPDSVASTITLVGLGLPEFVLGPLLVLALSVWLPLFPTLAIVPPHAGLIEQLRVLMLPALTVAVALSVYVIRMLRESLIETLDSEYVRAARMRGLRERSLVLRHALLNSLGPALNVMALNFTYLIGGLVVVETVFGYAGIGSLLVDGISNHDTPVIEAIVLIGSAFYIAANLAADVCALALNPRLRTA